MQRKQGLSSLVWFNLDAQLQIVGDTLVSGVWLKQKLAFELRELMEPTIALSLSVLHFHRLSKRNAFLNR